MIRSDTTPYYILFARGRLWNISTHSLPDHLLAIASTTNLANSNRPSRTTTRITSTTFDLFMKRYTQTSLLDAIRSMFRTPAAEREFRLATSLAQLGIPSVQPVALAQSTCRLQRDDIFITDAISGGQTMFDWIESATDHSPIAPAQRRKFAHLLAQQVAALHNAAIAHPDLHERNLVVRTAPHDIEQIHILDLHEITLHRRLPWKIVLRDLRRLGRYLSIRSTRTDRLRFFKRYAALRQLPPSEWNRLARALELTTIESRADFWLRRDTRPLHKLSKTRSKRNRHIEIFATPAVPSETLDRLQRDPDPARTCRVVKTFKWDKRNRVDAVICDAIDSGRTLVCKSYRYKRARELVASLAREDPATRAWRNTHAFRLREIPTPEPVILIRRKRCGTTCDAQLFTEHIPNARPLDKYLADILTHHNPTSRRSIVGPLIEHVARLIRKMHDRHATHHDLKPANILATESSDPSKPNLYFIDLDAARTWRTVPNRERIQNLARLAFDFRDSKLLTRTDRLRFLRTYLGSNPSTSTDWKKLWHAIVHWSTRKTKKRARSAAHPARLAPTKL